jgi:hypothetical protein
MFDVLKHLAGLVFVTVFVVLLAAGGAASLLGGSRGCGSFDPPAPARGQIASP